MTGQSQSLSLSGFNLCLTLARWACQAGVDGGFLVRPSANASSGRVLARHEEGAGVQSFKIEAEHGEVWMRKWHRRFSSVDALMTADRPLHESRR